jgi:hypothetical protein
MKRRSREMGLERGKLF